MLRRRTEAIVGPRSNYRVGPNGISSRVVNAIGLHASKPTWRIRHERAASPEGYRFFPGHRWSAVSHAPARTPGGHRPRTARASHWARDPDHLGSAPAAVVVRRQRMERETGAVSSRRRRARALPDRAAAVVRG